MERLIKEFAPLAAMLRGRQARAFLVGVGSDGGLQHQPVGPTHSVLDVKEDLLRHLSAEPMDSQFLIDLRDYCDSRLAARAEARKTGGVVTPAGNRRWEIVHVPAYGGARQRV